MALGPPTRSQIETIRKTEKNHYKDLRMREHDKIQRHQGWMKPWKKTRLVIHQQALVWALQ